MQNKNYKKILTFALVLSMMMPIGSVAADSEDVSAETADSAAAETAEETAEAEEEPVEETAEESEEEVAEETEEGAEEVAEEAAEGEAEAEAEAETEEEAEEEAPVMISDEEALKTSELASENNNLMLYFDEENERLCLKVKSSGKCWWTSPINAEADPTVIDEKGSTMKSGQIGQAQSSLAINVGDLRQEKRTELPAPAYSNKATRVSFRKEKNGVAVTYAFPGQGITKMVVHYELKENSLHVYVNTSEIEEKDNSLSLIHI